jgi:hypothetical protein
LKQLGDPVQRAFLEQVHVLAGVFGDQATAAFTEEVPTSRARMRIKPEAQRSEVRGFEK